MYWERSNDSNNEIVSQVRPLFAYLNKMFMDNAYVEEEHIVDKAMVPYTCRHGCKHYIYGKPIRYGFKPWVGTTRRGYIYWFEPYQGASTNISATYKNLGVGTSVICSLIFFFFFNRFLLENLEKKKMHGTGTIRENPMP